VECPRRSTNNPARTQRKIQVPTEGGWLSLVTLEEFPRCPADNPAASKRKIEVPTRGQSSLSGWLFLETLVDIPRNPAHNSETCESAWLSRGNYTLYSVCTPAEPVVVGFCAKLYFPLGDCQVDHLSSGPCNGVQLFSFSAKPLRAYFRILMVSA
jgi:hypothetical protein